MAKGEVKVKQNPQLKRRFLADGRIALYLEYYYGRTSTPRLDENGEQMYYTSGKMAGKPMFIVRHDRKKEELKLYLNPKPRTPEEREKNRETLLLAEKVRQEREQERLRDVMGYRVNTHKNDNLISFFDTYIQDYTLKDLRNIRLAVTRFKTFLRLNRPECAIQKSPAEIAAIDQEWAERHKGVYGLHEINENEHYRFQLKPGQLTRELVRQYADYLTENSSGEGAQTSFARFKKVVKAAADKGIIKGNPCSGIICAKGVPTKSKDVLIPDEIRQLIATHYEGENPEIRRAFIFSLYTGIRFCDVKDLTFDQVDYDTSTLTFDQNKTKRHSEHSEVTMPLRPDLLELIGTPEENGRFRQDRIFDLPSHTMCLKTLRRWTARAGIDKHITWHCARHSFATNILTGGANVAVVANLLGHSGLKYVEGYVRALDERKKAAVDSLPAIED